MNYLIHPDVLSDNVMILIESHAKFLILKCLTSNSREPYMF